MNRFYHPHVCPEDLAEDYMSVDDEIAMIPGSLRTEEDYICVSFTLFLTRLVFNNMEGSRNDQTS